MSENADYPPLDHSQLAGRYLIVLGILSLLGCNLAGLLFIWFGSKVQRRNERFRKASIWVLGLSVLGIVGILLWVTVTGTAGLTAYLLFSEWAQPPVWVVYAVALPGILLHGIPIYWLVQDRYEQHTDHALANR